MTPMAQRPKEMLHGIKRISHHKLITLKDINQADPNELPNLTMFLDL